MTTIYITPRKINQHNHALDIKEESLCLQSSDLTETKSLEDQYHCKTQPAAELNFI